MAGYLRTKEALAYFGLGDDVEALERLCIEHDVDVDVDVEGNLLRVDAEEAKAVLFAEHKRKVGYRPDDERVRDALRRRQRYKEAGEKRWRRERRKRLEERVKNRQAKRIP